MKEMFCKLLIIGAGPGGYVCAIRAGQLGIDTVIVEASRLGGTCLNVGCVPSKALIHAADEFQRMSEIARGKSALGITLAQLSVDLKKTIAWKDGIVERLNGGVEALVKKTKVKIVNGWATFRDGKCVEVDTGSGKQLIHAETIVIATGSVPVGLPSLPFEGSAGNARIISSTEALALTQVPKSLAVVGAGYIGLEMGTAFAKLGAKVTVVEAMPRILPHYDPDLTLPVEKRLGELGVTILTETKAQALTGDRDGLVVEVAGAERTIAAEKVLVAVGRKPALEGWGLEELVLDRTGPYIKVDDHCRTSMRGIYAVGDVTGEPMLAHRAMAQGEMVAEIVAGNRRSWDKRCIPAVCFTDPEVVTVGLSLQEARSAGFETVIGHFPFSANGRAMTLQNEVGFVRIIAQADNHLMLGIQAVGTGVAELSAAFSLAIEMGARLEDIADTIHAHPTQSEGFQEAALRTLGQAIHI